MSSEVAQLQNRVKELEEREVRTGVINDVNFITVKKVLKEEIPSSTKISIIENYLIDWEKDLKEVEKCYN